MTEEAKTDETDGNVVAIAKTHTINCTLNQRQSALNILLTIDIKPKWQSDAFEAIKAVRGDWPRNHRVKNGTRQERTDDGETIVEDDERDEPTSFVVGEQQRKFLIDFLEDFLAGKLERSIPSGMGGMKQEKVTPNGHDLIDVMPLIDALRMR